MGYQIRSSVSWCTTIHKGPFDIQSSTWSTFLYTSRVPGYNARKSRQLLHFTTSEHVTNLSLKFIYNFRPITIVNFKLNSYVNAWSSDRNVNPCKYKMQILSLYHSRNAYLREGESNFLFNFVSKPKCSQTFKLNKNFPRISTSKILLN